MPASICKPAEAVLLVAVTHATRRSTQRRILLALRDACYAKTPLQYLRAVRTPPLHHEQPIKATLLRGHLHNLRERLPAAKQWKKSNTTARGKRTSVKNRPRLRHPPPRHAGRGRPAHRDRGVVRRSEGHAPDLNWAASHIGWNVFLLVDAILGALTARHRLLFPTTTRG